MKRQHSYLAYMFFALSLVISNIAISETKSSTLGSTVNDSVITARVKSQFMTNQDVKATSINVETKNGIVKLTGIVDTALEAITAVKLAESTNDVKDVNAKDLHVKTDKHLPQQALSDDFITAKIQGLIMRSNILSKKYTEGKLSILTQNGDVILTGYVETQDQLDYINSLARSVPEVNSVISNIIVNK